MYSFSPVQLTKSLHTFLHMSSQLVDIECTEYYSVLARQHPGRDWEIMEKVLEGMF